jgi:hypothetical protein
MTQSGSGDYLEPPITVREEIEKRVREGQYFREAVVGTVSQRVGEFARRAGSDLAPVTLVARDVALSAFKASLGSGHAISIAVRAISLAMVRATSDLGTESAQVIARACQTVFEQALRAPVEPLEVAADLLTGAIVGARELELDPAVFARPAAEAMIRVSRKHGTLLASKLRMKIAEGIDGVTFDLPGLEAQGRHRARAGGGRGR